MRYVNYRFIFMDNSLNIFELRSIIEASHSLDLFFFSNFNVRLQSPIMNDGHMNVKVGIPKDDCFSIELYEKKMHEIIRRYYPDFFKKHEINNRVFSCCNIC